MNPEPAASADDARWLLSALADGEVDAAECRSGCAAWAAGNPDAQRSWHAYQLIGDVMRSDELASVPARDRQFLRGLQARLADEPALLPNLTPLAAPAVAPAPRRRRTPWAMPAAMAAGVMALGTVLLVARAPSADAPVGPMLAAAPAPAGVAVSPQPAASLPAAADVAVVGRIVRDAQLDRYLRAHRDYGAALPGSLPGGSGRSIATVSLER